MKSKPLVWVILFTAIMAMAALFLFVIKPSGLGLFGFPKWMLGFVAIELIYCGLMYWFVKEFWKEEKAL